MAEFGTQEWIDESLAQLDAMETERERLAAAGDDAAVAELDSEIQTLYAQLEQLAGDDEDEEEEAEPEVAPVAAALPEPEPPAHVDPEPEPSAAWAEPEPEVHAWAAAEPEPEPEPETAAAPFGDDPFGQGAPLAAAAGSDLDGFGEPIAAGGDDIEFKKGGKLKWVALLLVLVGGGVGGFMWWQGEQDKKAAEQADAAPAEAVTIEAAVVPEDTEDLKGAAKGIDAERTQGTVITGKKKKASGGGGGGGARRAPKKKGREDKIKLGSDGDPLG